MPSKKQKVLDLRHYFHTTEHTRFPKCLVSTIHWDMCALDLCVCQCQYCWGKAPKAELRGHKVQRHNIKGGACRAP